MRCPNCKDSQLVEEYLLRERVVAGIRYFARLPGFQCLDCNSGFVKVSVHKGFQKRLAYAVSKGPSRGDGFRIMRKWLGFRQLAMGKIFGIRGESICRWERGQRKVHQSAWNLLAIVVQELVERGQSSTLDRLYTLRDREKIESKDLYENTVVQAPAPKRGRPKLIPL